MSKMNILLITALLPIAAACGGDDPTPTPSPEPGGGGGGSSVTDVRPVKSSLIVDLSTDKAVYNPGETVHFTASQVLSGTKVRYRHGAEVIAEVDAAAQWDWVTPTTDFTGYMVELYKPTTAGEDMIYGTIAVDVSSDWTRFPRYGFVATFDDSKLPEGVIESEMEYLNRCHINGVQFQDWHWKHHWPLGGTREAPLDVYTDIANRTVHRSVVERYIAVQHAYGMKSIFYNLCFGVLNDAAADGVKAQWGLFKDTNHNDQDGHFLPSSWKSDIYLVDPANDEWLAYLGERNDDVYAVLDFDGYQIDQLGYRGDRYDYHGVKVNLPQAYGKFIAYMKNLHPGKRLVMNSVGSYGAQNIASSGCVDFCYNEMWDQEAEFKSLHDVIRANDTYSNHSLRTVFAAYMNYGKSGSKGEFNTPGVLLTDAVMFALGGSHLELGDHMLGSEYFPNNNLSMPQELRTGIIRYYDFMTAYENLLRGTDTSSEVATAITCTDPSLKLTFSAWPPKQGNIVTYSRNVGNSRVINLLNFRNVDDMSWRDYNGDRRAPALALDIPVSVTVSTPVTRVWVATPDYHGGAVQELAFTLSGNTLTFTVPQLRYWTMIVIE